MKFIALKERGFKPSIETIKIYFFSSYSFLRIKPLRFIRDLKILVKTLTHKLYNHAL